MDQRKVHVEIVRDGRGSLGTTGIRAHNHSILEIRNVLLDVPFQECFAIQVVDRNIKETLVLGIVQVHGNYVVGSGAGQEVCHQGPSLRNPLLVARFGLEELLGLAGEYGWIMVVVSGEGRGRGRLRRCSLRRCRTSSVGFSRGRIQSVGTTWGGDAVGHAILEIYGRLAQLLV